MINYIRKTSSEKLSKKLLLLMLIVITPIFLMNLTEADVVLNSPADAANATTNPISFNVTANITTGDYILNVSLWNNVSGTWERITTTDFNPENFVYDEIDDSSIDAGLWDNSSNTFGTGTLTIAENTDNMYINSQTANPPGATTWYHRGNISSNNLPDINVIENLTIRAYLQGYNNAIIEKGGSSTLHVFGTNIETIIATTSDTSTWTIIRNESAGTNVFDVYNDGVWDQQITASGNMVYLYTETHAFNGNGATNSIYGRIYYAYYAAKPTEETAILQDTINADIIWGAETCDNSGCVFSSENRSLNLNNIFVNAATYDSVVYETDTQTIAINVSTSFQVLSGNGILSYNGTNYSVIGDCNGDLCYFEKDLDIPLVTTGESQNKSFYWYLEMFDGTNSYNMTSDSFSQNVTRIHLETCGGAYTTEALNFTAYMESNLTQIDPFYFGGTFEFWLGDGNIKRNESFLDSSASSVKLCISPTDRDFLLDAQIDYYFANENITYNSRNYYFQNATINNVSQEIRLYLLNAEDSTSFIIKVQNQNLAPVADVLVHIQKYYPSDGLFRTVQVAKTDANGESVGFYQTETVDYKHIINNGSIILLETTKQKVIPKEVPYTLTFTVGDSLDTPWNVFEDDPNIQTSISFNKTTEIVTFTYIDVTGATTEGRLVVVKPSFSNSTQQVICNSSSSQSSATLTCNLTGYEGNFIAYGYIENSASDVLNFIITLARDIFEKEGLFIGLFIIMVAGFAFIWNPVAGVIGINAAVIFVGIIGLISFSPLFIFAMILVSFITIILLKT